MLKLPRQLIALSQDVLRISIFRGSNARRVPNFGYVPSNGPGADPYSRQRRAKVLRNHGCALGELRIGADRNRSGNDNTPRRPRDGLPSDLGPNSSAFLKASVGLREPTIGYGQIPESRALDGRMRACNRPSKNPGSRAMACSSKPTAS